MYKTWDDDNWIQKSVYEISTAFEANWNINSKAKQDKWNDKNRLEIWMTYKNLDTSFKYTNSISCSSANSNEDKALVISWSWNLCAATNY